jgi:outer membrane protein OmpA-like peptidoglycan-associated protein
MKGLLLLGVIGLVILCLLCPSCRAPAIEQGVRDAALACSAEVGLDPGILSVSGRDVTLTGWVSSEEMHAHLLSCVAAFPGTRTIDDQLQVQVSGALGFRTHYDDITLSGVVPTRADRDSLVSKAGDLWGEANVTDALEVDPGRTIGGWSEDGFTRFLAALRHSRRDLDIELGRGQAVVAGTVLSELAKVRVLGGAVVLLPGFEVVDRLTVREPSTPREILQTRLDDLLQGKTVEFATDSAELTARGKAVLGDVIGILKRTPGRVEISGHTDSTGAAAHNLELSLQRANAVAGYLAANGIDADRLASIGYGAQHPIASNATAPGQQMNRRTEFHALKEN